MKAFLEGIEGLSILDVVMFAVPTTKLSLALLIAAAMVVSVLAVKRRAADGPRSAALFVIGVVGPGLGLLAALYDGLMIKQASDATGVTDLHILAPSILGVLLLLGLSLIVAAIAFIGNAGARRI
ncbi:hypothetical protein [Asticcacaulis sp. AND118]|uniref:hypothetical protein n=1 Tax=Asticcacaulis sp. AND118 TaxID=2840468 RepID=UPI001CFFF0E2|nr:hypothetical protein [Asticcacaulis sp. AND118]UDF02196.1 hypothetical protein LH365_06960 [Asticcacaulis sp. AND118]